MPDHLQSRTDDMHKGHDRSGLRPSSLIIGFIIVATIAAILLLT